MPDWKRVKIDFETVKLGKFIEPVKMTIAQSDKSIYGEVYGVTNTEGIVITGKKASADISKYIIIDKYYFAYNPYRINVGSIGANFNGLKGCVSPAYVVFKTKEGLDPVFLWYYLKSDFGNHLINWYGNRGGVRNALRYDDLCKIDIPAIDYEKQLEVIRKVDHYNQEKTKLNIELENQQSFLKQLRQSLLQEAVEGKLTAEWRKQNPELVSGESHAARLLEKIKAEKEQLGKEGKIKKQKPLPPISEDEKPFDLPEGWVWCRLGDILLDTFYGPRFHKEEYQHEGIPTIRTTDMESDKIILKNPPKVKIDDDKKINLYKLKYNDLLITRTGSIGEMALFKDNYLAIPSAYLIRCRFMNLVNPDFFFIVYKSPKIQSYFGLNKQTGTKPNINAKVIISPSVMLPPIAEHQAIVEKVDRLMAKIDVMEEQVKSRKIKAGQLMQAVLREAFNGD